MVVPLPGNLNHLAGPPPPELKSRFAVLKHVVLALCVSLVLNLIVGVMTDMLMVVKISLNLIVLSLTGIFLMNTDQHLGPAYKFMMATCCQGCQEQCQGGMSCLMPFGALCFITLVMDVLVGHLHNVFKLSSGMLSSHINNPLPVIHVLSAVISVVARFVGSLVCWRTYGEARRIDQAIAGRLRTAEEAAEGGQQLAGSDAFQGSGNTLGGES